MDPRDAKMLAAMARMPKTQDTTMDKRLSILEMSLDKRLESKVDKAMDAKHLAFKLDVYKKLAGASASEVGSSTGWPSTRSDSTMP